MERMLGWIENSSQEGHPVNSGTSGDSSLMRGSGDEIDL
jgi:hypothetical protein